MKTFLGLLLACAGASLLASSCVSRPKGAYTPTQTRREPSTDAFTEDAAAADSDAGPRAGLPPSRGIIGDEDGSSLPADQRALLPLTGRYVMRADMHSVVEASQLFARLKIENTATNWSVAEVSLDPDTGKLQMTERMCYQRFAHECLTGCTKWSTDVDARVTAFFPYVDRTLTVTGNTFASETAIGALGYDGKVEDLPSGKDDDRVWDVNGDDIREGVVTRIHAEGTPVGSIECVVHTVQRFASSFTGELRRGKLDGASALLDTKGTDGRRLGASGPNAATCESDSAGSLPGDEPNTLRFARVAMDLFSEEAFWACPGYEALEDAFQK